MARQEILDRIQKYVHPFRVTKGKGFQLKDFDPGDTRGLKLDKGEAAELLQRGTEWLAEEQDMLYAQNRWSLLLVFQAMDAAGKDSTIKHVMSGVNPQGCQVVSFKQPTSEDLDHDFMWRYMRRLPERGRIGIFNRSYYEEVLVVRVHEEILKRQQLPPELVGKKIWDERFADITHFEDYLTRQGTIVLKFFLNLSREEQKRRFLKRLERPEKNWKFSASDVHERKFWDDYMHAFEEAIRATASKQTPWRYAALKSQRREAFWPLLSVLTSASDESPNSERHVAEQRSKGHAPISFAGQIQPAMPTRSEMLTHRRCLRADHLSLDSRGNSFALIQRQAERLRNRPILPFYSSHLNLVRGPPVSATSFTRQTSFPTALSPCQRPGA